MSEPVMRGFPDDLRRETANGGHFVPVDNGFSNDSKPAEIIGNVTGQVLVAPAAGRKLIIKGITIIGNGNQGEVKVKRAGGITVLPAYFSAQNRAGTSGSLNLRLNVDEPLTVTTTGRGATDETFVGVSYIELY